MAQAETYLDRTDVSEAEKDKFLARLAMPAGFVSETLLTPETITQMPITEHRALVNQTATNWLASGKYPALQGALQQLITTHGRHARRVVHGISPSALLRPGGCRPWSLQQGFQRLPDQFGDDLVALRRGMDLVALVVARVAADPFENERHQHRAGIVFGQCRVNRDETGDVVRDRGSAASSSRR